MRRTRFEIRGDGIRLRLGRRTAIMGVLNVTPDSFSDGGLYYGNVGKAVARARQMLAEGADIIDVGGESSRPGSDPVSAGEEADRIVPVIKGIRRSLGSGFLVSADTYKAEVAEAALSAGADMLNSMSGFSFDQRLAGMAKRFGCPVVMYHIRGRPKTMQRGAIRYRDLVGEVSRFFESQARLAEGCGIRRNSLLIDPGIGFGKTVGQNLELLRRLRDFERIGLPVVIGMSRKSHLGIMLKESLGLRVIPEQTDRLEAALAETAVAIINGAHVIRTHDVLQTRRFTAIVDELAYGRGSGVWP